MKRLALILIAASLVVIAYFQYKSHQRFNPPSSYDFMINDSIDVNFYDPMVVQQYYENCYKIGQFARSAWYNEEIDVLFPADTRAAQDLAEVYGRLVATTQRLEDLLVYSAKLKSQGYDNRAVAYIQEHGIPPKDYKYITNANFIGLKPGMVSDEVWEMQKILIAMGYDIPKDGNFGQETETALRDFQQKHDLFPSGILNERTLKILLNN